MEEWKYTEARRRVRKVKGFYMHFASWLIFAAFMFFINLSADPHEFWALYPIMSWGVAVAFHAIAVFGFPGLGRNWEERLMERELERIEREEEIREWAARSSVKRLSPSSKVIDDDDPGLELREFERKHHDSDFV